MTLLDGAVEDGCQGLLFRVVDLGLALERCAFVPRDLGYGALRRQVAAKDHQVAFLLNGISQGANHFLVLRVGFCIGQVLGHGLPRDGHTVAIQEACIEQQLHQRYRATDSDQVGHDVLTARFQVRENGDLLSDAGEVVQAELDPGRMRHRQEVQDGIGGAAQGHDDRDGIQKGLARHDVGGANAFMMQVNRGGPGPHTVAAFGL